MTISNQASAQMVAGDGITTVFSFNFVYDSSSVIQVYYIDAVGTKTLLTSSQYTLTLNAPVTNQLWGVGGTVTYPLIGSPIASGTYLYIQRVLTYTQNVSIQNQGNFYPQVTEQALDLLEMQIQQLANGGVPPPPTTPNYVFVGGTVTGTANALIVSETFPSNFALVEGVVITITPSQPNTGAATLNVANTGNIDIQRFTPTGAINVGASELPPAPTILQYINGVWFDLTDVYRQSATTKIGTDVAVGLSTTFSEYYLTRNSTFTVAKTTTLPFFWWIDINAAAGDAILNPNASDVINVLGTALAAGTSYTIPHGGSARLGTDGAGNLFVNYFGQSVSSSVKTVKIQTFTNSATYTPSAGMLYCIAEVIGGGGGGGGAKNGGSGTARGGAGGGGAYARKVLSAATVGTAQAVTIGAAGSAGSASGGNGGNGGATSVGALATANGGSQGTGVSTATFGAGGAGGTTGTGDVTIAGQAGGNGFFGGQGGNSPLGWGYSGPLPATEASAGLAGSGYGAGGSSGHDNTNTGFAGAAGTAGYVVITEYCSQ